MAGLSQFVAEMRAAQILNEKESNNIPVILGVVNYGNLCDFLQLEDPNITIDTGE